MREFAKFPSEFWINECWRKIKRLSLEAKLIAPYLLSNPHSNMIGVYYLPIPFVAHETGLGHEAALQGLQELCGIDFCTYDQTHEYIWVHNMAFDQLGTQLNERDNRIIAIHKICRELPDLSFLDAFYDKYSVAFFIDTPSKPLASKEKEKKKEKEKEIILSDKPHPKNPDNKKSQTELQSQALEVLHFLNEKAGKVYRASDINLNLIMARLKSGASVMDCRQIIAKKNREWKSDVKMCGYLRPATLFNPTKFEQYLGELVIPDEEKLHERS